MVRTSKKHIKTFKKHHCSLKNSHKNDTCLDDKLLIKIGNILNQYHKANIKINNSRKKLYEEISKKLSEMSKLEVFLDIKEVRKPEVEAKLVAENIANQLEKRISFRRAMKKAVQSAMRLGAKGVKVVCSGRLGGAEIARTEKYHEGSVPLHTLRGDIDYATAEADTTYGICGIKVWINKGEILSKDPYASEKKTN